MKRTEPHRLLRLATAIVSVAAAAGCRQTTSPPPRGAIVGTYVLTTTPEWYTFARPGPGVTGYDSVPAGPAMLSGTLILSDSMGLLAYAPVTEQRCAGPLPNPCAVGGPMVNVAYFSFSRPPSSAYHFEILGDTMGVTGMLGTDPVSFRYLQIESGRLAGDAITGRISWGDAAPSGGYSYKGTFVARRSAN
jgi:hypothetical protein